MKLIENLQPASISRLDYLDGVRAFALLLGIVFHASLSFMPIFIGWAVMDISTSNVVAIFAIISHSFRMEIFFLIAGFFAYRSIEKHGVKRFVISKLIRVLLPFILGWIILRPLLVSGWTMGAQSMQGDVDISAGLFSGLTHFNRHEMLVGTHLWFLYYLLLFCCCLVTWRVLLLGNKRLSMSVIKAGDYLAVLLGRTSITSWFMVLPVGLSLWFMNGWNVDTPDKSLLPHMPVFLLYGSFFILGLLLARKDQALVKFSQLNWHKMVICLAAIAGTLSLSSFEAQPAHPDYLLFKGGYMLSYALMMCALVMLTLGVFRQVISQSNKVTRYIADASYWLYLIHLPVVVWLQIAVAELPWHWGIKLATVCGLTLAISLVLYDFFVRSSAIGKVLNGRKRLPLWRELKGQS